MILEFIPKEPDKAYVSNLLWLPKSGVRVGQLKSALEFQVPSNGQQISMSLWGESKNHIICPREFLTPSEYPKYPFPFIDLSPEFQTVEFEDLVVPRDEAQERAWQALAQNDNGILNLGCGRGKTRLALKKIAQRKTPTLVVVPDGGILSQWKEAILGSSTSPKSLNFDGGLGIVQGPVFDWTHPITLALITTLALRIRDGSLPEGFARVWGQVIYDEVHILGAPVFGLTAPAFYGDRIGLTATVNREDGLDPIFRYHIGEPFYSDLSQDLIPRIYFQQTGAVVDHKEAIINGNVNISILRSMLGTCIAANTYRYWSIKEALDQGRKILCLSHSKNQLKLFQSMFPGSGLLTAETPKDERMGILRKSKICFAISKLGSQGIDDDRLDTLFWLTPFRSRVSLQQSMGRIQRQLQGKKTPVMVVFEDYSVPPLKKLCMKIRSTLREWMLKFETVKPLALPTKLPIEVQKNYDDEYSRLQPDERAD